MKRVICLLLSSLIVCVISVGVKFTILPLLMQKANFGICNAAKQSPIDIMFIGSSMFRQGIDIDSISKNGITAYLLVYNGNQPYFEYQEIKNFFDRGGKMKTLVVDMYIYSLMSKVRLSDIRLLLDADLQMQYELYKAMKKNAKAAWTSFYRMAVLSNNELLLTWPISFPLINSRYKNGGNLSHSAGTSSDKLNTLTLPTNLNEINQAQIKELYRLVELCHKNGVNVIFLESPKYKRVFDIDNSYVNSMSDYIKALANVDVKIVLHNITAAKLGVQTSNRLFTYSFDYEDSTNYQDLLHLSYQGRVEFSESLLKLDKQIFNYVNLAQLYRTKTLAQAHQ